MATIHQENKRLQRDSIDLGLEIAMRHSRPGVPMTQRLIAAFCDCHHNAICEIEREALKKLRHRSSTLRELF